MSKKSKRLSKQRDIQEFIDDYIVYNVRLLHPELNDWEQFDLVEEERGHFYTQLAERGFDTYGFEYTAVRPQATDFNKLKQRLIRGRTDKEVNQTLRDMRFRKEAARKRRLY